jgi:hypothetical protein
MTASPLARPVLALALLTSCASSPAPDVRRANIADARTIAVVNAVGRQAQVDFVGFVVFMNFEQAVDVAAWGLDGRMQREVSARLPKHLEVRAQVYTPELEKVVYLPVAERGIRSDLGEQVLLPYIDSLMQRTRVDLVLFVLPLGYPALRIDNARMGLSIGHAQTRVKFVLMDTRTRTEVYGKGSFPLCKGAVSPFEFRKDEVGRQVEEHREEFSKLWMNCFADKLGAFATAAGL